VFEVPAFCPHCGAIFGSGIVLGELMRRLTLTGNKARCPVCDQWGDIPDGVFNVTDGALEVLCAPAITRERLERLRGILDSVRQGTTAPAEAVELLVEEAPELQAFLTRLRRDPATVAAWLALLLALISFLLAHQCDTINVQHVTETVIQQCVQEPRAGLPR
jgi:hypothetical protein